MKTRNTITIDGAVHNAADSVTIRYSVISYVIRLRFTKVSHAPRRSHRSEADRSHLTHDE